jgi:hypothetical protein
MVTSTATGWVAPGATRDGDGPPTTRWLVAGAVGMLVLAYVLVIVLGDSRAWSGSDAGGKVATVKVMAEQGRWVPDVGYWAQRWDPSGSLHPLLYTTRHGGHWVQATSLPFVYAGALLWRVGGAPALLVLPVVGAVLAALGARAIARRLGTSGWPAFWLVGLVSPVAFYAADFWEHSMAVGLVLIAVALALGPVTPARAAGAGALLGLGAVLRTEILVYGLALGVAVLAIGDERRRWLARPAAVAAAVASAASVLVANSVVERLVLGAAVRDSRAGSMVSSAGSEAGSRGHDAVVTTLALFADTGRDALVLGGALVVAVAVAGAMATGRLSRRPATIMAAAVAVALYAVRWTENTPVLGFIPGLVAATPLAIVGVVGARRRTAPLVVTALFALPLVWMFSWRGQLVAQWGGRYVLTSGALLAVAAAVALDGRWRTLPVTALVAAAVLVSSLGAAWHVQRTRGVARAVAAIERVPPDTVVVSRLGHLGREGGYWYGDHRWLDADAPAGLAAAARVARAGGVHRVDVVELVEGDRPEATFAGYRRRGERTVSFLGFPLRVTTFVR